MLLVVAKWVLILVLTNNLGVGDDYNAGDGGDHGNDDDCVGGDVDDGGELYGGDVDGGDGVDGGEIDGSDVDGGGEVELKWWCLCSCMLRLFGD